MTRRLAIMTVRSVILFVKPLLKLFVIAWAALVSKVYYKKCSLGMYLEETETSEPSPLDSSAHSGMANACRTCLNTIRQMPHNGWIMSQSPWISTGTKHQPADKETIMVKTTIAAITIADKGTTTAIKVIETNTTPKEMPPLRETLRTPASNVEKKGTTLGTVQNAAQTTNIIRQPI